jgi:hypothetical protein
LGVVLCVVFFTLLEVPMSRHCVLASALAWLVIAAPTARAATVHHHLEATHVANKGAGTFTHGKTAKGGHAISTTHGPKGKVRSVQVDGAKHQRVYKVARRHAKSQAVALAPAAEADRTIVLTADGADPTESCQGGVAAFAAFVIQFGGHTFIILIPVEFVSSVVVFSPSTKRFFGL